MIRDIMRRHLSASDATSLSKIRTITITTVSSSHCFIALVCCMGTLSLVSSLTLFDPPGFRGDGRFFLDTADTAEWDAPLPLGIFHGVTTNPTLLECAGHPCTVFHIHQLALKALSQTSEFMCQSWGQTADALVYNGMALSAPNRHVL